MEDDGYRWESEELVLFWDGYEYVDLTALKATPDKDGAAAVRGRSCA